MAGTPPAPMGLLVAVLCALLAPGTASAVTDSVALSGNLAMNGTPSAESPANTGFEWVHHITTSPAGSQPDTADGFKVLFPSPLILNAQDYPACPATSADGAQTLSAECRNSIVGSGTATMYAGSPGSPLANSVKEDLTVTAVNGTPAGSTLLLILNSTPAAPVVITNRVVTGTIAAEPGHAFATDFKVPADLQKQLGLSIAITDLDVTISGTPRAITVGAATHDMSYLQLTSCSEPVPLQQVTTFVSTTSTALSPVTSDASVACVMGAFVDPPGYPTAPYTSPRVPSPGPDHADPPLRMTVPAITVTGGKTSLGRLKARRNGSVALRGVRASCPSNSPGACPVSGRATRGRVVVATLSSRVAAGASSPVNLKLTKAGKRLLARSKSTPLTVVIKATTPAGAPAGFTATRTLKLTLVR